MEEVVINKICKECGENKPINEFYYSFNIQRGYGYYKGICKKCHNNVCKKRNTEIKKLELCRCCMSDLDSDNKTYCKKCSEFYLKKRRDKYFPGSVSNIDRKESRRLKKIELRKEIFTEYGNKCECCGEKNQAFFNIDHIKGDGKIHRDQIGSANLYYWLKRNNFPKDNFRILCFNCNLSRSIFGYCPHQFSKEESLVKLENKLSRKIYLKRKIAVYNGYGQKCALCNEDRIELMTIDHVNNDGWIDRKIRKISNDKLYQNIIDNNFPTDKYRMLCFNCNCSRSFLSEKTVRI